MCMLLFSLCFYVIGPRCFESLRNVFVYSDQFVIKRGFGCYLHRQICCHGILWHFARWHFFRIPYD